MTTEQYENRKAEIERQVKNLQKEFALANNTAKNGDIITDHIGSIEVVKIDWRNNIFNQRYPSCIYQGYILKKDGKRKKITSKESCIK